MGQVFNKPTDSVLPFTNNDLKLNNVILNKSLEIKELEVKSESEQENDKEIESTESETINDIEEITPPTTGDSIPTISSSVEEVSETKGRPSVLKTGECCCCYSCCTPGSPCPLTSFCPCCGPCCPCCRSVPCAPPCSCSASCPLVKICPWPCGGWGCCK